jgi:methionine biosynthesis protein MetW
MSQTTTTEVDATRYQKIVQEHGLSGTHREAIRWVPKGARVLELGCASGYISRLLMDERGAEVVGVEIDPRAAQEARAKGIRVFEGSLSDPAFRASLGTGFDVVMATDVLEHLPDPAPVLAAMRSWLKPSGVAIIAVPNVATWRIRAQLFFRGDFEYQDEGILDRTHLHFFTWDTLHALVRAQGWRIEDTFIDGFELPGFQRLLFEKQDAWVAAAREIRSQGHPIKKRLASLALYPLYEITRRREQVGTALAKAFPNLCAPHVMLKLSPGGGR